MLKSTLVLFVLLSIFSPLHSAFAQSPGGVSTSLDLWLKADSGTSSTSDNTALTAWTDSSPTGNDAAQGTAAHQATYQNEAADLLNYNPVVEFNGTSTHFDFSNSTTINRGGPLTTKTYSTVFRTGSDVSSTQVLWEQGNNSRGLNQYISGGNVYCGAWNTSNSGTGAPWGFFSQSGSIAANTTYVVTQVFNGNSSITGTASCYLDGVLLGTTSNVGQLYDHGRVGLGAKQSATRFHTGNSGGTNGQWFSGAIPELTYYNQVLSSGDQNQVESYLALKWGITLDQTTPVNYLDSAGAVVFHATTSHAGYRNDIAGIGEDSTSALNQTQSRSNSSDSVVSMIETGGDIGTGEFVIWGNDNAPLTETSVGVPTEALTMLSRTWRADVTGTVGFLSVQFDVSGLTVAGTTADDFALVQDSTNSDFSSGATVSIAASYSGGIVTFDNIQFSGDDYFTLATSGSFTPPETDPPVLQSFSSSTPNDTYGPAELINITATYDEPLGGGSSMNVQLDNGASVTLDNISGSTIYGTYTVGLIGSGEDSSDLTVSSITTESVNDVNSNNQNGSSLPSSPNNIADTSNIVIDTTTVVTVSPGGVNSSLNMWLTSDAGTNTTTDGGIITSWIDQSTTANNAVQNSGGREPTYQSGSSDLINNNPIIRFDGGNDHLDIADSATLNNSGPYAEKTFSTVFKTSADVSATQVLFEEGGTGSTGNNERGLNQYIAGGNVYCGAWNLENDGADAPWGFVSQSAAVTANSVNILTHVFNGNSSGTGTFSCYLNGLLIGTSSNIGRLYSHNRNIGLGGRQQESYYHTGGVTGGGDFFAGEIPEIAYYNQALSTTDRNQVESYLALKWGLTLDQTSAQDYRDSAGNIVYHATTTHSGFLNDIAGIAQDTSSGLNQTLSRSQNSDSIVTITETGGGMSDGEFLIWGNNNGSTTETTSGTPSGVPTILPRTWRADETGDVGTVSVQFDISAVTISGMSAANFVLLIDADGNFATGATQTAAAGLSSNVLTFNNISFASGDYFTIATVDSGPPNLQTFTSSTINGSYGPAGTVNVTATYDESLNAGSTMTVVLDTGVSVVLNSISGATISGTYTIGALGSGQDSADLTVSSISSENVLDLSSNARTDSSTPPSWNNIAGNSDIVVDTTAPVIAEVTPVSTPTGDTTPDYTFSSTEVITFSVSGGCDSADTAGVSGNNTITLDSDGAGGALSTGIYNCSVTPTDSVGNVGSALAATAFTVDVAAPTLQSFSSTTADGTYGPVEIINITATYNEAIGSGSTITVQLDNGVSVTLDTISGSSILGSYTVGATGSGQNSSDLTVSSITSESVSDVGSNTQTGSSVPTSPNNIADTSAIVIDTTLIVNIFPGGIDANLSMWLKANVGTGTTTDNTGISAWADQSTAANNATQGSSGAQPTYQNETADLINSNAVVRFDGSNDRFNINDSTTINTGGPFSTKTFTTVFKTSSDVTSTQVLFEEGGTGSTGNNERGLNQYISGGNVYCGAWNLENDGADAPWGFVSQNAPVAGNSVNILTHVFDGNSSGTGTITCYLNGELIGTSSNIGQLYAHVRNNALGGMRQESYFHTGGVTGSGNYFIGPIPEFTYYNQALSSSDRNRVESYLALKWGVTLDQSTAQDYQDSAGNVIYHATTTHSGFVDDIAGIGQDNTTGLNQLQSRSENADSVVTMIETGGAMDDGEFIIWGNNDASTTQTVTGVPAGLATILPRTWRVDETGDVGTLSVQFDLAQLAISGTLAGDFVLLRDTDSNFSSGATQTAATSLVGDILTFENISFTSGDYFTIAAYDTDPAILQSFSSSTLDGSYGPTDGITITANYDENLGASSTITVALDNGVSVVLNSISGATLSGTYTVGATGSGEDSADLTVGSISSENVLDLHSNAQTSSTVPTAPNNLSDTSNLIVDTTAPSIAEVLRVSDPTPDSTPNYTFSSTEAVSISFLGGCNSVTTSAISGNNLVTLDSDGAGGNLSEGTYNCSINASDAAGNSAATLSITAFTLNSPPLLSSFTSSTGNGSYGPSATVNVTATFNENLGVGSTMSVTLNSGGSVTLSSISGLTLSGTYTVGAVGSGQNISDLAVSSISSASITDGSVTGTSYAVPVAPNNISDTSDIAIDTTLPVLAEVTPVSTPTLDGTPNYTFSSTEIGTIAFASGCDSTTTAAVSGSNTVTLDSDGAGAPLSSASYTCTVTVTDTAGNSSAALAMTGFTIDAGFTLSGTVTDGTNPVSGVSIDGGGLGTEVTAANGTYSFPAQLSGTAYSITPSIATGVFSPSSASGTLNANEVEDFTVNRAPVLDPLAYQEPASSVSSIDIALVANDPDNDPITYTATVVDWYTVAGDAYYIDQLADFRLDDSLTYLEDTLGQSERWIYSDNESKHYIILPNGELYRMDGPNFGDAVFYSSSFDSSYYTDPTKFFDVAAPPPFTDVTATIVGSTLTLTFDATKEWDVGIVVHASDGSLSDTEVTSLFAEAHPNVAPVITTIPDQAEGPSVTSFDVLVSVTDPDGNPFTLTASALNEEWFIYDLDQYHDFYFSGDYQLNTAGQNEKWFPSANTGEWFIILPMGEIYRWVFGSGFNGAIFIGSVSASYYTDPTGLMDVATPAGGFAPTVSVSGTTITVTPNGFIGTFTVGVIATDSFNARTIEYFDVVISNTAPVLAPIADQNLDYDEFSVDVTMNATDPETDPITYSAFVLNATGVAYYLDQANDFYQSGAGYMHNSIGQGERWILSATLNKWHIVLPDGALYRWDGSNFAAATFIGQLDASFNADPSLLFDVAAPAFSTNASTSITGTTLTVTRIANFDGVIGIAVVASDGFLSSSVTFNVIVAPLPPNTAPVLDPIPDQLLDPVVGSVDVNVNATDGETDPITYSASTLSDEELVYSLDQVYDFFVTGNYQENSVGHGEKWFRSNNFLSDWYIILPDGSIYQWVFGGNLTNAIYISRVGSSYHTDPSTLVDVSAPSGGGGFLPTASVSGSTVTLFSNGHTGFFAVMVTASDGRDSDSAFFHVEVKNTPPVLNAIANQTMTIGVNSINVPLTATDAEFDPISFTATVLDTANLAYVYDQELDFRLNGSYMYNSVGQGERWILSQTENKWYIILPDGELYKWTGSNFGQATYVTVFDASYNADPSLLFDVSQPAAFTDVTTSISGSMLTIDRIPAFMGDIEILVTASDGVFTVEQSFTLTGN